MQKFLLGVLFTYTCIIHSSNTDDTKVAHHTKEVQTLPIRVIKTPFVPADLTIPRNRTDTPPIQGDPSATPLQLVPSQGRSPILNHSFPIRPDSNPTPILISTPTHKRHDAHEDARILAVSLMHQEFSKFRNLSIRQIVQLENILNDAQRANDPIVSNKESTVRYLRYIIETRLNTANKASTSPE